jgi:hypothetical protein
MRLIPWGRVAAMMTAALAVLLATGCVPINVDPSSQYFPTTKPDLHSQAPIDPALSGPPPALINTSRGIERPNLQVTPGGVSITDAGTVCNGARRVTRPPIVKAQRDDLLTAYNIPVKELGRYRFDYLVPLEIGGSTAQTNLWPMSLRGGIGFHEKAKLNSRIRVAVCTGQISLSDAQKGMVTDWFQLWVKFAAY